MSTNNSINIGTNQLLTIANNLSDVASISTSRNNLGLGTAQNVQFAAIKLTTGANNGYILTSDAAGNGIWQVSGGVTSITGTANQIAASSSTGSITLSLTNGLSIGSYQATSPPAGGAILPGKVGIGTSSLPITPSSSSAILTSISASSSSPVFFGSASNSQSASAGGIVTIAQDDGSPMITGARLGIITFAGPTDSSHTLINSSAIASFTVEGWDSTDYGSRLSFYTTPAGGGSPALTEGVRIAYNSGVSIGSSFVSSLPPSSGLIVSGSVGIGQTTVRSGAKVSVTGIISLESTGVNQICLNSGGSNFGFIANLTTGFWCLGYGTSLGTLSTNSLSWNTNGGVCIGNSYATTAPPSNGAIIQGKIGVGTSSLPITPSSSSAVLTAYSSASSSPSLLAIASNAQGATAGGTITVAQDDSTAMNPGSRLGIITFAGSEDTSHTLFNASSIASFAAEGWDSTDYGSYLSFSTTPTGGGSPSRTEVMRIGNNGGIGIGSSFVSTLPPANGCIISGPVGIGTTTTTGFTLNIVPTTNVYAMVNLSGTVLITDSGGTTGTQFGINNRPIFRPTANPAAGSLAVGSFLSGVFGPAGGTLTTSVSVYASALFTSNAAHIVGHRGIFYDGGGSLPAGSLDSHVGLWIENPAAGTNKLCAYFAGSISIGAQVFSGISLIVQPISTCFYLSLMSGIISLTDTGTTTGGQRGLSVGTTFTPSTNPAAGATALNVVSIPTIALGGGTLTTSASFYAGVQFFGNAGTIVTHYGYFYDGGGALSGTLTTHYGLYINQPAVGTTKICAYFGGPIQFGVNTTGATTALLATANCPAVTGTSPYNWLKALSPDGSTVYIPCWK